MGETHAQRQKRWEKDGHMTSVQCSGISRNGQQCKRRTRRSEYCYFHLEQIEHVKIKKSGIPHSGMGLYTTIPVRAGKKIAFYGKNEFVNRDPDYGGTYAVQVKRNSPTFINAWRSTDSAGRFSNMARSGYANQGSNNAGIGYSAVKHSAFIKAGRHGIPAGREVKTSYGRSYW